MNLGKTCNLKRRDNVMVWPAMLLLCCYEYETAQHPFILLYLEQILMGLDCLNIDDAYDENQYTYPMLQKRQSHRS